jgi:hypothetical protein
MSEDIQTTIKYEKKLFIEIEVGKDGLDIDDAIPFKRTDYHEDGSQTIYYGLEITPGAYKHLMALLGGMLGGVK